MENKESRKEEKMFIPRLLICGINTPVCVQLLINSSDFSIGYSEECNGVLRFNREISKLHCRVVHKEGNYSLIDCGSTNGTYLNGSKLEKDVPYPLREGDRIRLSTSTFAVETLHNIPKEVV